MKFPNHILLDVAKPNLTFSTEYWIFKYLTTFKEDFYIFDTFNFHKKFLFKKENLMLNKLLKNQKKFTIRYSLSNESIFLNSETKSFYKNIYKPRLKVKRKILFSKHYSKEVYDFLKTPHHTLIDSKFLNRLIKNFKYKTNINYFTNNNLNHLFDINFLKKEKMYTKLKYSRVPQYDMVSGGVAALFSAFLGFLITEKFGFELVDSGDFFYLFMYVVFICFFGRLFLKLINNYTATWSILSYKWFVDFYKTLFVLFMNFLKTFKKFKF